MPDMVNQPPHYTAGKVEAIEAIEAATIDLIGLEAFCTGNAIKYLFRWKKKGGHEDLRKAIWYIKRILGETDKQLAAAASLSPTAVAALEEQRRVENGAPSVCTKCRKSFQTFMLDRVGRCRECAEKEDAPLNRDHRA